MSNPFYKLLDTFDKLEEGTQRVRKIGSNVEVDDGAGNRTQYDQATWDDMNDDDDDKSVGFTEADEPDTEDDAEEIAEGFGDYDEGIFLDPEPDMGGNGLPAKSSSNIKWPQEVKGAHPDEDNWSVDADPEDDLSFEGVSHTGEEHFGDIDMEFDPEITEVPGDENYDDTIVDTQSPYGEEWDDFDQPEYEAFDVDKDSKRLRPGTPIIFDDSIGGGSGVFNGVTPSGRFGTAERNGRKMAIHLSSIAAADLTHSSIYEEFENQYQRVMEEITVTRTDNAETPDNDTITITGTGEHVDALTDIMKLAGMEGGDGQELPQDAEIPVNVSPEMGMEPGLEPGMGDMMSMIDTADGAEEMEGVNEGPYDTAMKTDWSKEPDDDRWLEEPNDDEFDSSFDDRTGTQTVDKADLFPEPELEEGNADYEGKEVVDEVFANEPEDATELAGNTDTMVNGHSGGLNKQKKQYRKEYPGDNIMTANESVNSVDSFLNLYKVLKTIDEG